MDLNVDFAEALAMLDWQVELGATEAIGEVPINRYEEAAKAPVEPPKAPPETRQVIAAKEKAEVEWLDRHAVEASRMLAESAADLGGLQEAMAAYEFCELKKGARNLVFADGNPVARLMIIGEAPGRDEDIEGLPFVGRSGQLLDKMLAAIDMSRRSEDADAAVYIANVLPWRPPQNRDPSPGEIEMLLPFLKRHIELVQPEILVPMGNIACQAVLGRKGITRLRSTWAEVFGLPALPMFHPAYLLRSPEKKREAWMDLLEIRARLKGKQSV